MNPQNFHTEWLSWLPSWWQPEWTLPAAVLLGLLLLVLLWRLLRAAPAADDRQSDYDPDRDQFASSPPINEDQIALMHYLQKAFPEGAVLFRPSLARFLAVRKTRQRIAAQQRLASDQVDFLICGDDGKPLFAFEVDAFKDKNDPSVVRSAAEKNRMLKTAGIRLVRLKGAHTHWPPPEALRMRMLAVQRTNVPSARATGFGPSEFSNSTYDPSGFAPSRSAPSTIMGMSTLMGMEPVEGKPWDDVRKRS